MTAAPGDVPPSLVSSARGCLIGLAVGDALGQRTEGWSPAAIAERWGYIDDLPAGDAPVSDDTEYALFSASVLLEHGLEANREEFADAWLERIVPQRGPFKGAGFSEMAAIENLRRGLRPPESGRHFHSWSDGLAMRVAPFGVAAAGDPRLAARLAREDGLVSNDGEGIFAGEAVAAAVAVAAGTATLGAATPCPVAVDDAVGGTVVVGDTDKGLDDGLTDAIAAALAAIPRDSWTHRNITKAVAIGERAVNARGAIPELHDALAVRYYPWADLAPEAVGLSFGLLVAGRGRAEETLLAAVNLGRDADTVAAIAGAVLGALYGEHAFPQRWLKAVAPATGRCLACVAGMDLIATADALATIATSSNVARIPERARAVSDALARPSGTDGSVRGSASESNERVFRDTAIANGLTDEDRASRVQDVIRTLCVADGLAWQNLHRRSRLMAPWTRRLRREIEAQHEQNAILDEALPFALNQPPEPFATAPGANAEWLTFQLRVLRASGGSYDLEEALAAWLDLSARRDQLRLTIGQHAAVANVAAGMGAPASGHDNPHYFDDSACFRAVAFVCLAPDDHADDMLALVAKDAAISNASDGVRCAQAFALGLHSALGGAGHDTVIRLALEQLPAGTWGRLEAERKLALAAEASHVIELIDLLADQAGNHLYDYGNCAPETLGASLAIVAFTGGELNTSLLAALGLPRLAASVAPMVGALCGALGGAAELESVPAPLLGVALPHLAGLRPLSMLEPSLSPNR